MKTIIHIEDEDIVYNAVREGVDDWFDLKNVAVQVIDFEKAAANFVDEGRAAEVALIIVDLMIAYDSDENQEIPREVLLEGSFDAGFRLIARLRSLPGWRDVPIIVYSSIDKNVVEEKLAERGFTGIPVVQKTRTLHPLLTLIREMSGLRKLDR
jgi:hypothetical protein